MKKKSCFHVLVNEEENTGHRSLVLNGHLGHLWEFDALSRIITHYDAKVIWIIMVIMFEIKGGGGTCRLWFKI